MQLRLVGDGQFGLACRNQLGRIIRIGGRHQFDVQAGGFEVTLFLGDDQRRMVRIDKPVQHDGDLVLRVGAGNRAAEGEQEGKSKCPKHKRVLSHCLVVYQAASAAAVLKGHPP